MQHLFHVLNATKMEKQFERKLRPRKGVKTMQSPTALNKRGNKVTIDGYIFDSEKAKVLSAICQNVRSAF